MTEYRGSVAKQVNDRIADGERIADDDAVICFIAKLLAPIYGESVQVCKMGTGRNEVVHFASRR